MASNIHVNEQPNILIVDDISTNLVILSEMIKQIGCIPRSVTSVRQAQTAIERKTPQLILLDISMPDTDGFEFCAMLKADIKTRDIPIIFISALDSVENKIKGFKLGAVDYIAKPFEKEEVTLRLNTHLKIYKMQQEMEEKQYEATAGGGVITAVVSGKRELVRVTIDPEAVDPDDVEMLQDMVVAAVNEAMRKAEADSAQNMSKLTGGLNLGGLFG